MLTARGYIPIPPHTPGAFDHADVYHASGRVYVANSSAGTVDVLDGPGATHLATIAGCPDASGVLCAQKDGLVFAAARATGNLLVLNAGDGTLRRTIGVGQSPNGLAWDSLRKRVLVADVTDNQARLLDPYTGNTLATAPLPGRPRWCVYDSFSDRFLVNIREPSLVQWLATETLELGDTISVPSDGPHGLEVDAIPQRAYVATDARQLVALDLVKGSVAGTQDLSGPPDAIWLNPQRHVLYSATGDPGAVDVLDIRTLNRLATVPTERGAHTLTFDPQRQRLYVFLPESSRAAIFEEVE